MKNHGVRLLIVLTAMNIINFMDRQLISILLPEIKAELHLTDTDIGFLAGAAFAIFYAAMGLPLAWIADRVDRRRMISVVLGLWSLMTALTAFVGSYTQLLLCRIGVAVGEAGGSPPSYAMISDAFPPASRPAAISVFTTGGPLGGFAALMVGGWIAQFWGWRAAFLFAGVLGLMLVPIVLTVIRDPRHASDAPEREAPLPFLHAMRLLFATRSFVPLAIAASLSAFASYSLTIWSPSFLIRSYEISVGLVGTLIGLFSLVGGVGGALAGGWFARRMGVKDLRWWAWTPALGFGLSLPVFLVAIFAQSLVMSAIGLGLTYFAVYIFSGPLYASINTIVAPRMRSTASASMLLIQTLLGLGLGPLLTGYVSDMITTRYGEEALRYALLLPATAMGLAIVFYLLTSRGLREDAAAA